MHATMHGCARGVSAVTAAVTVAAAIAGGVLVAPAPGDPSIGRGRRQDCGHPTTVSAARAWAQQNGYETSGAGYSFDGECWDGSTTNWMTGGPCCGFLCGSTCYPHCGLYAYSCAGVSTGGNANWHRQAYFGTGGSAAQMSSAVHIVGENEGCSWYRPIAAGCQGN